MKIFLAANSAEGFISHFGNCYDPSEGWRAYIIKGGPGTGKSSFMKRVKARAEEEGEHIVEVFCASDPASLDGLILQNKKLVFIDGTAPHVVEPRLPGVCENLLDFGRFWNADRLALKRTEITVATEKNKGCHSRAAELGFDEILLSDIGYPTEGKLEQIAYGEGEKSQHILTFSSISSMWPMM